MKHGIRGQLVHELTAQVSDLQVKKPLIGVNGAHGVATVSFEEAGTVVCIDAAINGFDPVIAVLRGGLNSKDDQIFDFSSKKLAPGRFNGCDKLSELTAPGTFANVDTVTNILSDPTAYYFQFHQAKGGSQFNNAVRGQLDDVIV